MGIIGTGEYNNEIIRMNSASMIYDKNKEFRFSFFAEECIKLCYYDNIHIGVKE